MSRVQETREDDHIEDTGTEMEHDPQTIEKDLEESENDERHQIENKSIWNMRKIKEPRGDDDLVDTDTESENGPVRDTKEVANTINKNITILIADNKQDKEVNN